MGMGPLEDLIKMIPGMNQVPGIENVKVDPKDVERKSDGLFYDASRKSKS